MGAKLYINFDGKYTFDHASMMLLKELQRLGNEQLIPTKSVPLSQAVKSEDVADAVSVPLVKSWTEAEILDWRGRHSLLDDRYVCTLESQTVSFNIASQLDPSPRCFQWETPAPTL